MKKITFIIASFVLVMCSFLCGCNANTKTELTKIRLNEVTHSIFYAPLYVAINNGYFEQEGINIELTNGGGADKVMTAILSGDADIGLMGPEATIYVTEGGTLDKPVVFGQLTKRDGSFLVSRTKQDDFKWENVKNSIIIYRFILIKMFYSFLEANNILSL